MANKKPAPRRTTRAQAPPADDDFQMLPNGQINWKIGDTIYVLDVLKIGDYQELDWLWRGGSVDYRAAQVEAIALPGTTMEEKDAKLAALEAANKLANEWLLSLWERLFKTAESKGRPFPGDIAPAWISRPNTFAKVLDHLQGPPPPGVA